MKVPAGIHLLGLLRPPLKADGFSLEVWQLLFSSRSTRVLSILAVVSSWVSRPSHPPRPLRCTEHFPAVTTNGPMMEFMGEEVEGQEEQVSCPPPLPSASKSSPSSSHSARPSPSTFTCQPHSHSSSCHASYTL